MWRIIYTRPDGGVSIVIPAPEWRNENEAEGDWQQRVMARSVPADATKVRIIDEADLPQDRTNRDAWRDNGRKIEVDPTRVKPRVKSAEERLAEIEAREAQRDAAFEARIAELEASRR